MAFAQKRYKQDDQKVKVNGTCQCGIWAFNSQLSFATMSNANVTVAVNGFWLLFNWLAESSNDYWISDETSVMHSRNIFKALLRTPLLNSFLWAALYHSKASIFLWLATSTSPLSSSSMASSITFRKVLWTSKENGFSSQCVRSVPGEFEPVGLWRFGSRSALACSSISVVCPVTGSRFLLRSGRPTSTLLHKKSLRSLWCLFHIKASVFLIFQQAADIECTNEAPFFFNYDSLEHWNSHCNH